MFATSFRKSEAEAVETLESNDSKPTSVEQLISDARRWASPAKEKLLQSEPYRYASDLFDNEVDRAIGHLAHVVGIGSAVLRVVELSLRSVSSELRARNRDVSNEADGYERAQLVTRAPPLKGPPTLTVITSRKTSTFQKLAIVTDELRSRGARTRPQFVSKQLLVTIRADAVPRRDGRMAAASSANPLPERLSRPFEMLEREGLIDDVTAVYVRPGRSSARSSSQRLADSVLEADDDALRGVNLLRLTKKSSINEAIRALADNDAVENIERVPFRTLVPPTRPRALSVSAGRPWNLEAIRWYERGVREAGAVRLAVLDTGVDEGHPSLSIGSYEHGGVSSEDIVGHGTHVCGIIAGQAAPDRGFGGGVCNAKLWVWKIFGDQPDEESGEFFVDEVMYLRALNGALSSECRVMNLSIGGSATSSPEKQLFKRLINGGVSVVAAMGNEYLDGNPVEYPAAHDDIIAVGAVAPNFRRAPFSNTGSHIALVAPGEDIVSTLPLTGNRWRDQKEFAGWSGTSMAAPHVAAAVAHLIEANPGLSVADIKAKLQCLARTLPTIGAGWSRSFGAGLLQLPHV